jgi:maleate isomerase
VRELARAVAVPDAEAVFLSCTNLPTVAVLPDLEHDLDRPVLSANLVSLWSALRTLDELPADRPERLFQRTAGL